MDLSAIIGLISRWAHVLSVITLVGGTFFSFFVFVPAAQENSASSELRAAMRRRWARLMGPAILFLLLSGFYNAYVKVMTFHIDGLYLGLLLLKIVLGLVVVYLLSRLAGRSEKAEKFREREQHWLKITSLLMLVLIMSAGVMKMCSYPVKERDANGDVIELQDDP